MSRALHPRRYIWDWICTSKRRSPLNASDSDGVQDDGRCMLPDDFIPAEEDKRNFRQNPQDYEWSFRLFHSY